MANFGPSKTWTDGEVLSHTDLNAALLDIINNVTNNNINADNIDETDDYAWSGVNSFSGGHSIKVLSNAAGSIVTGTTLEWDPADGGQMTDNSSGISIDFKLPDASDNQDVFASIAAICLDDAAGSEDGELSFRVAVGGTNTEKMTLSNSALTVTPAITASGGVSGNVTSSNVSITGGSISGITDLAIADGGTNASTASAARTNLGLAIGSDIQAYDAGLAAIAGLAVTDGNIIVGNGSTWVAESAGTARTSLGLGSIATQAADAVSISGGSLTGMTSYSGGTISGTTGTFSGDLAVDTDTLFVDVSADKVSINAGTSPSSTLHIQNTGTNAYAIEVDASDGGNLWGVFEDSSGAGQSYLRDASGNPKVVLNSVGDSYFTGGNVGINTASPASPLHIIGGDGDPSASHSGDAQLILENNGTTFLEIATDTSHFAGLTFSDGTATRGAVLYDHGTGLGGGADSMHFQTAGSIRSVITSDGLFGFGTVSPAVQVQAHFTGNVGSAGYMVAQNGYYVGLAPNDANETKHIDDSSNGGGTSSIYIGNEVIQTSSDIRAKKNISDYTDSALSVLDKARVVEFEYRPEVINDDSEYGPASRGKYVGLIAQEMIEYARWAVNDGEGDPEGEHIWTAKYELMVPLLIKAVQELTQRVAELENN